MSLRGDVVLVDWLGRGGIAQCSEAWALELRDAGHGVVVVTRPERELGAGPVPVSAPLGPLGGRTGAHRAVVAHAVRTIRERRPRSVVVQNYVLPPLERPVHDAARAVGARLVVVVHDHRLHTFAAGTHWGLRGLLRRADVVVTHSPFVAERVADMTGRRDVAVLPVPRQRGMLDGPRGGVPLFAPDGDPLALHFGVLHRRYKGADTVAALARSRPPGWRFGCVGVGASTVGLPVELAVDRFVGPAELVATVAHAEVTLLPYRTASQSGAVVLAQALGSVVVASAVGGIPDQIQDGRTGVLIAPGAPVTEWSAALDGLRDATRRRVLADAARAHVEHEHHRFAGAVRELAT